MPTKIWRPPVTASIEFEGMAVELIPLGPPHRDLLAEAFSRLSERSRYYRFMAPVSELSRADLTYLTEMDMVNRFAWGIIADGTPAAVGRYARTTTSPDSVDVGITVVDEYQGRGLGPLLIECLAVVVRASGFSTMEFDVLAENKPMLRILEHAGVSLERDGAIVHGSIPAADVPLPPIDADLLLAAVGSARAS